MRQSFLASSRIGLPVLQHAEVPGHGAVLAAGPIQESLGIKAYPRSAEVDMVKRDLKLLADYPGAKYHVLHISCRETIDLVSQAKAKGLQATCEVTPHHLMLCSADIIDKHTSFKMNPPLRDGADRDALQRRLATGEIDFVSTDHAPHENEIKGDNFKTAAFGTLGLETSLRVLLDLQRRGVLSKERVVEVFSKKPAEFLNVADKYGTIAEGKPFFAALVDSVDSDFEVTVADLPGKSKNSCFVGRNLPGRISHSLFADSIFTL
jgi:dihydroorotase